MKRIFINLILALVIITLMLPFAALAEETIPEAPVAPTEDTAIVDVPVEDAGMTDAPNVNAGEPFTWAYLATIAGAAAFTLIFVQFFKVPLDRVWKIPTRVFAYIVALVVMLVATAFTTGLDIQTALLAAVNAIIAALTAYGAYEVTFSKIT